MIAGDFQIPGKDLLSIDCASISFEDKPAPVLLIGLISDTPIGKNQGMTVRSGFKGDFRTF